MLQANFTVTPSAGDVLATKFTVVNLTSGASVVKYIWDPGTSSYADNKDASSQFVYGINEPTFTYKYPGTYTITLTAIDFDGNKSSFSQDVAVDYVYRDYVQFTQIPEQFASPGLKTSTPFEVSVISTAINSPLVLDLFASNSLSTPYQFIPKKWNFLSPTWKFLDKDLNFITALSVEPIPIYKNGTVVAVSGSGEFYYVDSMSTGDPTANCPILITATLQTSGFNYPLESNIYPYNSYTNSETVKAGTVWLINDLFPNTLKVTGNYINNVQTPQWENIKIPVTITAHSDRALTLPGSESNLSEPLFSFPSTNLAGIQSPTLLQIQNLDSSLYAVESSPLYFQSTDSNNSRIGGYIFTSITSQSAIQDAVLVAYLSASTGITYPENKYSYPYGYAPNTSVWVSNPEQNTLNKITLVPYPENCKSIDYLKDKKVLVDGIVKEVTVPSLKTDSTFNYTMSGFSGIYSVAIDPRNYEVIAADAELDRLYKFSNTGEILKTFELSSLDTIGAYASGLTPASVCLDKDYNIWVSLFNSVSVLKFDSDFNLLFRAVPTFFINQVTVSGDNFALSSSLGIYTRNTGGLTPFTGPNGNSIIINDTTGTQWAIFDASISVSPEGPAGWLSYLTDSTFTTYQNYYGAPLPQYTVPIGITTTANPDPGSTTQDFLQEFDSDFLFKPPVVETNKDNNCWVSYAHPLNSTLVLYSSGGYVLQQIQLPQNSVPVSIITNLQNNLWVASTYNVLSANGIIELYDPTTGAVLDSVTNIPRPGYLALDRDNNLWFTYGVRGFGFYDTTNKNTYLWDTEPIGEIHIKTVQAPNSDTDQEMPDITGNEYQAQTPPNPYMTDEDLGGLAVDVYNRLWIIDSYNNNAWVFSSATPDLPNERIFKIRPNNTIGYYTDINNTFTYTQAGNYNYKSAQAAGDWTGNRWYQKYAAQNQLVTVECSGISAPFDIIPFQNQHQIRKINESFNTSNYYHSLALPENLNTNDTLFNKFFSAIVGTSELSANEDVGQITYEKIANFINNHADIDTCNISQLLSLAEEVGVPATDYSAEYPAEISRMLDIASTPRMKLWGIKNDRIKIPQSVGDKYNTQTDYITAGTNMFLRNKFDSALYLVEVPPQDDGTLIYPISAFVGWGFIQPVTTNYILYKFDPVLFDGYIENIIDWDSPYTTQTRTASSAEEWYGDGGAIETAFKYLLTKNLFLK